MNWDKEQDCYSEAIGICSLEDSFSGLAISVLLKQVQIAASRSIFPYHHTSAASPGRKCYKGPMVPLLLSIAMVVTFQARLPTLTQADMQWALLGSCPCCAALSHALLTSK